MVQMNDEIRTGPKSRAEISFRDNTKLSLGENARVVIDRFVFNPDESTGELVLSTGTAAFRMVTGKIGEMQNKKINVSTPFAALAVRGTDFWWGPVEGQNGVLLVSNSRVDVRNDECDKARFQRQRPRAMQMRRDARPSRERVPTLDGRMSGSPLSMATGQGGGGTVFDNLWFGVVGIGTGASGGRGCGGGWSCGRINGSRTTTIRRRNHPRSMISCLRRAPALILLFWRTFKRAASRYQIAHPRTRAEKVRNRLTLKEAIERADETSPA